MKPTKPLLAASALVAGVLLSSFGIAQPTQANPEVATFDLNMDIVADRGQLKEISGGYGSSFLSRNGTFIAVVPSDARGEVFQNGDAVRVRYNRPGLVCAFSYTDHDNDTPLRSFGQIQNTLISNPAAYAAEAQPDATFVELLRLSNNNTSKQAVAGVMYALARPSSAQPTYMFTIEMPIGYVAAACDGATQAQARLLFSTSIQLTPTAITARPTTAATTATVASTPQRQPSPAAPSTTRVAAQSTPPANAPSTTQPTSPLGASGQSKPDTLALARRALSLQQAGNHAEPRTLFKQSCDAGEARACSYAGEAFLSAQGGAINGTEARRLYRRGCELGSALSCNKAGFEARNAASGNVDSVAARGFYKQGCDLGNATACGNLALMHFEGEGGPKDFPTAMQLAGPACTNNIGAACYVRGKIANDGLGRSVDFVLARTAYERGCSLNNGQGCNNLGNMYGTGRGGPENDPLARTTYEKACGLNQLNSCSNLAMMHYKGEGGAVDRVKARELFTQTCAKSKSTGCQGQMAMMVAGDGGPRDAPGAFALSERICLNGQPSDVCGYRGVMIHQGTGTSPDQARGLELMRAACAAGHRPSCDNVTRFTASPARK